MTDEGMFYDTPAFWLRQASGDDGVVALQTGDSLLDGILGAEAEMGEFGRWHGRDNFL